VPVYAAGLSLRPDGVSPSLRLPVTVLGHHRPAFKLQQIRRRLYGHGSTQDIMGRLTTLLTSKLEPVKSWIAGNLVALAESHSGCQVRNF
jgi:hypothetical protein